MKIGGNIALQRLGVAFLFLVIIVTVIALVVHFTQKQNALTRATVVTNGYGCSDIAVSIFEKGGNAADAAIAALFCEGVSAPQSMGLGGGFLLTLYNRSTGEVWTLNTREIAPAAATEDMFGGDSLLSQKGGKAVAVPGELLGYGYLYEKFGGSVPWKDLVQPTIDLCVNGIYVTNFLAKVCKSRKELLYADPVLRDIFIDPTTNDTYLEGQYIKRPRLAKTLQVIAVEGGYALNGGSLTERFVKDIADNGGIITVEDMKTYKPQWQKPINTTIMGNNTLYSVPPPGSGAVLALILNILSDFLDLNDTESVTTYQRIIESFKFGYGQRTKLGDPNFVETEELLANLTSKTFAEEIRKLIFDNRTFEDFSYYGADVTNVEDHGTAHISILAPDGDAVAVTSTINFYFGAGFASNSTGIIVNDEMDDFSSPNTTNGFGFPASPANYIVPGKRPLSSMSPAIILDQNNDVLMVTGAAGGSKIITAVALTIIKNLWFGMDIKSAVDDKRVHHQLYPMSIAFDQEYATEGMDIVEGLHRIGHNYTFADDSGFAAVTSISRSGSGQIKAAFDRRRPGSISYILQ